ncbi:HipA family kinase [Qipengyuania sphaerica]|uniref:HipA family kinase n=1 Tax=Qipengyuania sphaerica TaxID=2867243 RepID=UPI001C86B1C1|nr:HipA family kinase [Qipengyuania sphaerica]MBX7540862.1 hypothetical protein [Qipengyuania sphaerica]
MLTELEAIQYVRDVGSGRTKPIIVAGEDPHQNVVEVVIKFSSACDLGTNSLAVEVIAACLAGDLGLPIPEPFVVRIPDDWRDSLPPDVRVRFSEFDNLAFGSKLLWPQWPAWASGNRLTPPMVQTAAEILAFDGFIENVDRRDGNPNCLVNGEQLRIIDHELAFPAMLLGPKPWQPGGLQSFTEHGRHIFRKELVARPIDGATIRQKWSLLQDHHIESYGAAVPDEWRDEEFVTRILTKVRDIRENIDDCMTELDRILQ